MAIQSRAASTVSSSARPSRRTTRIPPESSENGQDWSRYLGLSQPAGRQTSSYDETSVLRQSTKRKVSDSSENDCDARTALSKSTRRKLIERDAPRTPKQEPLTPALPSYETLFSSSSSFNHFRASSPTFSGVSTVAPTDITSYSQTTSLPDPVFADPYALIDSEPVLSDFALSFNQGNNKPKTEISISSDSGTSNTSTAVAVPAARNHNAKKPEGYTPRPPNAWILYRSDRIKKIKEQPEIWKKPQADISKMIALMWKEEGGEVKAYYEQQAELKKAEHLRLYPNYKYSPRRKGKDGAKSEVSTTPKSKAKSSLSKVANSPSITDSPKRKRPTLSRSVNSMATPIISSANTTPNASPIFDYDENLVDSIFNSGALGLSPQGTHPFTPPSLYASPLSQSMTPSKLSRSLPASAQKRGKANSEDKFKSLGSVFEVEEPPKSYEALVSNLPPSHSDSPPPKNKEKPGVGLGIGLPSNINASTAWRSFSSSNLTWHNGNAAPASPPKSVTPRPPHPPQPSSSGMPTLGTPQPQHPAILPTMPHIPDGFIVNGRHYAFPNADQAMAAALAASANSASMTQSTSQQSVFSTVPMPPPAIPPPEAFSYSLMSHQPQAEFNTPTLTDMSERSLSEQSLGYHNTFPSAKTDDLDFNAYINGPDTAQSLYDNSFLFYDAEGTFKNDWMSGDGFLNTAATSGTANALEEEGKLSKAQAEAFLTSYDNDSSEVFFFAQ